LPLGTRVLAQLALGLAQTLGEILDGVVRQRRRRPLPPFRQEIDIDLSPTGVASSETFCFSPSRIARPSGSLRATVT
jgi:hypothetical protein